MKIRYIPLLLVFFSYSVFAKKIDPMVDAQLWRASADIVKSECLGYMVRCDHKYTIDVTIDIHKQLLNEYLRDH